ncbi:MAG: hypothetical protein DSZ12_04245 [Sulfurovum sp.]|nr:MAG: hypothetical protein DSZ08_01335 [Sulfurovum sp.]RUM75133.1 MAG: hypothetical protein DSZ12_04245 [Sulfurovum sp.]
MDNLTEYIVTASNGFYFNADTWQEDGFVFENPKEAREAYTIACNDMEENGSDVSVFLIQRSVAYNPTLKSYDFERAEEKIIEQKHISLED